MGSKRAATSLFRCLIMGPPGSGKGTVSERIIKHFPITHISSGDHIRQHIRDGTQLGEQCKGYLKEGKLVPDELITEIMKVEIGKLSDVNWLLDGFPRTGAQAKTLDGFQKVDKVVCLDVPFDIICDRLSKRWIHAASGRIYNLDFNPPKVEGKDDITDEPLVQREDDKAETVLARLNSYKNEQESPVTDFFSDRTHRFKGKTTYEIWPQVFEFLETQIKPTVPFRHYQK